MPFKFIDGVAIADVAFEARGKTIEAMFISAGEALMNTQVKDLRSIGAKVEKRFSLENKDEERLLHDFLQELIFLKDAELLLFREYEVEIAKKEGGFRLSASLRGEQIDQKKHELLVDVKAVSWHMFKIEKTKTGWKCFVILDV
ncbi:MAG TPA: archease [Candidatus Bilamarchaeum sp.]|nr:archease [Candidatus Bilamarchaeum sp.]